MSHIMTMTHFISVGTGGRYECVVETYERIPVLIECANGETKTRYEYRLISTKKESR